MPGDVLNGVGNKHRFTPAEGLAGSAMTPEQQRLLRALVEEYVDNADFDAADAQLAAIEGAGWDDAHVHVARPAHGDLAEPFYYRVQGPRLDHRAAQLGEPRSHHHARPRQRLW